MITKCLLIEKEVMLILKPLVIFFKNADISILIFLNFLVGNNHMNLCTKYNVYIMFLTVFYAFFCPGMIPIQAESINSDLRLGLD